LKELQTQNSDNVGKYGSGNIEIMVGKEKNAQFEQFLLFSQWL